VVAIARAGSHEYELRVAAAVRPAYGSPTLASVRLARSVLTTYRDMWRGVAPMAGVPRPKPRQSTRRLPLRRPWCPKAGCRCWPVEDRDLTLRHDVDLVEHSRTPELEFLDHLGR